MVSSLFNMRIAARHALPFAAIVAAAAASISSANASEPDDNYLRPERYPAHIVAVNFGTGRMTAQQPVTLDGWQVRVRPEVLVVWREIFNANATKPLRGIHVSAFCRQSSSAEPEPCTLILAQHDEGEEIFPVCRLAVSDGRGNRRHVARSDCPTSIEFGAAPR